MTNACWPETVSIGGKTWKVPSPGLVIALTGWTALNVILTVFNKWALSPKQGGFHFPVFYSSCHMLMSVLSASIIMIAVPSTRTLSFQQLEQYGGKLLLLSTLTVLNITTGNASLVYIGLSINQIIKSVGPLPALILTYMFQNKRYSWQICGVVGLLVCGAALSVPFGQSDVATPYGLFLASISCVASSSKPILALILMQSGKSLPPLSVLWYDSFFSFWVMIIIWAGSEERAASIAYMQTHTSVGLKVLGFGSGIAFLYNLSMFYLTYFTSGLTINVIANTKQVVLITISAIFIDHITQVTSWIGVGVFVVALTTYTYLTIGPSKSKHQWVKKKPTSSELEDGSPVKAVLADGPAMAPATEKTPLASAPADSRDSGSGCVLQ